MTTTALTPRRALPGGINTTFFAYELRRRLSRQTLIFTLLLPAVLYLALVRTGPSGGVDLPHGNFAAWMMIGMAVYGAAMAATSSAATISIERSAGWMRTIRLSPMRPSAYILVKVGTSVAMAVVPVLIVGVLGSLTGAEADAQVWLISLVVAWLGSAIFAALGIGLGLALKPEIVMHMPGLTLTALAFLGNLFIPLTGVMLDVSRWTPMYGVATLARYPLTDGYSFDGDHASLAGALINIALWLVGFTIFAVRRFKGSTGRA
jgi:ABC-2 type transport system permease protein